MCYVKQEPEKEASMKVPKAAVSQPATWDGLQKQDGPQTLPSNFTELKHVYSLVLKNSFDNLACAVLQSIKKVCVSVLGSQVLVFYSLSLIKFKVCLSVC